MIRPYSLNKAEGTALFVVSSRVIKSAAHLILFSCSVCWWSEATRHSQICTNGNNHDIYTRVSFDDDAVHC